MYTERYEPRGGAVSDVAYTAIHMVNAAPTNAILSLSPLDREQRAQDRYISRDIWKGLKECCTSLHPQSNLQIIWLSAHMLCNSA